VTLQLEAAAVGLVTASLSGRIMIIITGSDDDHDDPTSHHDINIAAMAAFNSNLKSRVLRVT
jgi:hypothetical protein